MAEATEVNVEEVKQALLKEAYDWLDSEDASRIWLWVSPKGHVSWQDGWSPDDVDMFCVRAEGAIQFYDNSCCDPLDDQDHYPLEAYCLTPDTAQKLEDFLSMER